MSRRDTAVVGFALLCMSVFATLAFAQWIPDGNPVSTAPDQQNYARVIGDTQGGVIVAWTTNIQGGVNYDLYIERYDGFGQRLWSTSNGITVAALANNQWKPAMVPDDSGGVYIAWEDNRSGNYDVYAQHFDKDGNALWGTDGRVVCNDGADQGSSTTEGPKIVRSSVKDDKTDLEIPGVIICWMDYRDSGTNGTDLYAQRMEASGATWTANGVVVCDQTDSQASPQMVSDLSNGAIVAWTDARGGIGANDIYAQRINSAGQRQWTADGEPVCTAAENQLDLRAVSDGVGGAYVTWIDHRLGLVSPYMAYLQRIDGAGAQLWTTDGIQLYGLVEVDEPELVRDATGGVIVCWRDARFGNVDLFAQRVNSAGVKQWTPNGEAITTRAGNDYLHRVSPDGEGGMVVTWVNTTPSSQAYIQRIDSTGAIAFTTSARLVTNAPGNENFPDVCIDGSEPAFVAWSDNRAGGNQPDMYLTRVYHTVSGVEPRPAAEALVVRAHPNPFSATTRLSIDAPGPGSVSVEIYDVAGRLVARRTVVAGPGGAAELEFDGRGDDGRAVPSGVYLARVRHAGHTQTAKIVLTR